MQLTEVIHNFKPQRWTEPLLSHVRGAIAFIDRVKEEELALKDVCAVLPTFSGLVCMYNLESDVCFTPETVQLAHGVCARAHQPNLSLAKGDI